MEDPLQRHHCVVYICFTLWAWPFHTWLPIGLPFPLSVLTTSLSYAFSCSISLLMHSSSRPKQDAFQLLNSEQLVDN